MPSWTKLLQFDPIWFHLIQSDPIWSNLIQSDPIWTNLFKVDPIWSSLIQSIPIWSSLINLIKFDPIYSTLFQFDQVWSNLIQFKPILSYLKQMINLMQFEAIYLIWIFKSEQEKQNKTTWQMTRSLSKQGLSLKKYQYLNVVQNGCTRSRIRIDLKSYSGLQESRNLMKS